MWSGQKSHFEPNFQHKSKFFLILQNFILCRSGVVKLSISSQIFNATENFWILPNFILHRSGMVINLISEPNFQHKSEFFWILSNFIFPCLLTGGNWQKWKRVFLTCPCHKIYRDEAVGLKSCKYTWKITKFVKMGNLGQNRENLIFCQ